MIYTTGILVTSYLNRKRVGNEAKEEEHKRDQEGGNGRHKSSKVNEG